MPGTSRHHWGSDVDLYALDDIYFEYGDGEIIYGKHSQSIAES